MLIKIDCREKELYHECNKQKIINEKHFNTIQLKTENLPLGDIIICDSDGNEKVMIERKTLSDLAASIRDGRYKEQSFRLHQCNIHNHNIFYLIEGDLRYYRPFKTNIDKYALLSAMVSITYFKGFSLQRTTSITETAEWLMQFALKIQKEMPSSTAFYNHALEFKIETKEIEIKEKTENNTEKTENNTEETEIEETQTKEKKNNAEETDDIKTNTNHSTYAQVMHRVKKNNITKDNIGEIMLAQIPGVSVNSAMAIMKKVGSIAELITQLKENNHLLNTIMIEDAKGKPRKINKTCISNIYDFLIPNENII